MKTAECVECGKEYVIPARQVGPRVCGGICRQDYLERKKVCVKCYQRRATRNGYCDRCYPMTEGKAVLGPSAKAIKEYEQRYGVKFPWYLQVEYVYGGPDGEGIVAEVNAP